MALLEVKNLDVRFAVRGGDLKAIRGISFSLDKGERLGLVGESGAGKSVAAFSILNLIARPGYKVRAVASPAAVWLRRFSVPLSSFVNRGEWSVPALVTLRFDPDPRSATALRRADPDWALRVVGPPPRDQVTRRLILPAEETTAP